MAGRVQDKVAVVTGAGSGMGRASALLLGEEGALLAIHDVNEKRLHETAAKLPSDRVVSDVGDISKEPDVQRFVGKAVEKWGRVDVLANVAGKWTYGDPPDFTLEAWHDIIDTNLTSQFLCCKYALPHMQKQKKGSIINFASISSYIGQEFDGMSTFAYNITKAGARQLTTSLATRYGPEGIRVNCICPGAVRTNILEEHFGERGTETSDMWDLQAPDHALKRVADASEIARCVLFLASDESSFVTGLPMWVDGGYLSI